MIIAYQIWVFSMVIALGSCRPKLDRVEERNEELSGPDATFAYHNPPNSDVIAREEETEEGVHRLSKRLAEPPQQKLVYLDPIFVVDDKAYSDLIKKSKSLEEQQYADNNEDDLDLAAAIVYRPLFAYRLQKTRRLARRRNPRSIHSTLPNDSKSKLLYRTENDLMTKVIIIFLPVYTHEGHLQFDEDDVRAARSADLAIKSASQEPKKQKKEDEYSQQNDNLDDEILIVQPSNFIKVFDDGDPLEPAESSVVHPLFLYKYRVAYYKKKEQKEKKRRQQ